MAMPSMSLCAANRMVPPGVSYTPRDFMPTKRFSTMSMRPMPFFEPRSLSMLKSFSGSFSLLPVFRLVTFTGAPSLKKILIFVALFGAFSGDTVLE